LLPAFASLILLLSLAAFAADTTSVRGTVTDSLGAVVPGATVELRIAGKTLTATTDAQGNFSLALPASGHYSLTVSAKSFQPNVRPELYASSGENRVALTLSPSKVQQQVSVSATGSPLPLAQVGSAVAIVDESQLRLTSDVQQPLRAQSGLQLTQTGNAGATTSLFVRGGNSDANKVLIDGVPANYAGGFAEFAGLTTTGISEVEVLRSPNSALYGADALSGVISMTSQRGSTALPYGTVRSEGGNFGSYRNDNSLGGAYKQFDYYSEYDNLKTSGNQQNSTYHYGSYAGNFGWTPNAATSLRLTLRNFDSRTGLDGSIEDYGFANNERQHDGNTLLGITFQNQTTEKWNNLVRYGRTRLTESILTPGAAGTAYDPWDTGYPSYIGNTVTLNGANGYSATGQAILDHSGIYPNTSVEATNRDFAYGQSQYSIDRHTSILGSFRYEHERGASAYTGYSTSAIDRGNYNYAEQINGDVANRLYYSLGVGIDDNSLFGVAVSPRLSLAYHLFRPASGLFSGTKLRASFNKGIKEPSISQESGSLYNVLQSLGLDTKDTSPVGPQRVRSYDGGIEQSLGGRATISVNYFHNQYLNGVEYVPSTGLIQLGYFTSATLPSGLYGAYVNSQNYRAQGVELEGEYKLGHGLFVRGGYTRLNAVVQKTFSSDPVYNPLFPTIAIGAYAPLAGARPFRRAPNSGYFAVSYEHKRFFASLTGTLVGKRDDSTFLSDKDYGYTMLLPNKDLDPSYQRLDLGFSYQLSRRLSTYTSIQNLLSQHYDESFGYRALPFTFRSGLKFTFGGSDWKL
jgi:iron complex outermembrane receptor protein/vitamin B12 transporter